MKKILLNLFLPTLAAALLPGLASATVITPQAALNRVMTEGPAKVKAEAPQDLRLVATELRPGSDEAALYIFASEIRDGFMVVSADDQTLPLLGWTDSGRYDRESMSPSFSYWIGEYARQIAASDGSRPFRAISRPEREPIAPLLTTFWDQASPYNDKCPQVNGMRSMTGCAATALAQVMNYHKWPAKGVGSHSYSLNGQTVSFNFGTTTFDWENMLDDYSSGTATDAQKNAVATLMFACGVSLDMKYSPYASGATAVSIAPAMAKYFNYSKSVYYAERDYHGLLEWEELVYNQLVNYGPVQYSGQSSTGGHSFVCDGYNYDGYFHINWGWGGVSDGYFLLTALAPDEQGIGGAGSGAGFNFDQSVIANVAEPGTNDKVTPVVMMNGDFTMSPSSFQLGGRVNCGSVYYNYSIEDITITPGVKLVNKQTEEVQYIASTSSQDLPVLSGFRSFTVRFPADLAAGQYVATPAYQTTDGEWHDLLVKLSNVNKYDVLVKNSRVTLGSVEGASISVSDLTLNSPIYIGSKFNLTANVNNTSSQEFYGTVSPALMDENNVVTVLGESYLLDIMPEETFSFDYNGEFPSNTTAGDYTLTLVDNAWNPLCAGIPVTVNAKPTSTRLLLANMALDGDANDANSYQLKFVADLRCTAGFFGGSLDLAIFPYTDSGSYSIAMFSSDMIYVEKGETKPLVAQGAAPNLEIGKQYCAAFFNGNTQMGTKMVIFRIGHAQSGLFTVEDVVEVESTEVYNLSGMKVSDSNNPAELKAGIYIVRDHLSNGETSVRRVVIR